jgi:hypothetical protein
MAGAGDALLALGDEPLWQELLSDLNRFPELRAFASVTGTSADDLRGRLALRLGLDAEAERHFERGIDWATAAGFGIDVGRCAMGLAEITDKRGDHGRAMQHLDHASQLFARHGASLYLDEVLARKEFLEA